MNIHDFIEEFRSVIVATVGRDFDPIYHPGKDRKKIYELTKNGPSQVRSTRSEESFRPFDRATRRFLWERWV